MRAALESLQSDVDEERQMDEKGRLRWVVVLTAIGSFMAALDTLVVASALSTIKQDLGASLTDLEWTVNAYNLSFAVLLVPAAVLGDRLGRARTYAAGLALFALASAGCAAVRQRRGARRDARGPGRRSGGRHDPRPGPAHLGLPARAARRRPRSVQRRDRDRRRDGPAGRRRRRRRPRVAVDLLAQRAGRPARGTAGAPADPGGAGPGQPARRAGRGSPRRRRPRPRLGRGARRGRRLGQRRGARRVRGQAS